MMIVDKEIDVSYYYKEIKSLEVLRISPITQKELVLDKIN